MRCRSLPEIVNLEAVTKSLNLKELTGLDRDRSKLNLYMEKTSGTGCVLMLIFVTTPKFPLPAPRSAQNKSRFEDALAMTTVPSQSTWNCR